MLFFGTVICETEPADVKNHPARVYIIAQAVVAAWIRHYMTGDSSRRRGGKRDLFSDMDHFTWVIFPSGLQGGKVVLGLIFIGGFLYLALLSEVDKE